MEQITQNDVITKDPPHYHDELKPSQLRPRKKKHGPMHAIKVALFMMRGRSRKQKVLPVDDRSKSIWRKLLGSIRPLHLQGNQSPRACLEAKDHQLQNNSPSEYSTDEGSDVIANEFSEEEPYSPSPPTPSTRYASAVGLSELVQGDEDNQVKQEEIVEDCEEQGDGVCGDGGGDEMIDAKADEFIAQFYKDIRLQSFDNNMDPYYSERSHRSLGY